MPDDTPNAAETGGQDLYPQIDRVVIWAWPKTIVFWPTCLFAFIFGGIAVFVGPERPLDTLRARTADAIMRVNQVEAEAQHDPAKVAQIKQGLLDIAAGAERLDPRHGRHMGIVFLLVFGFNLVAFSFDIRLKGLAIGVSAALALLFLLLFLSVKFEFELLRVFRQALKDFKPVCNAAFYLSLGCLLLGVLLIGMLTAYLRRCEVSHNDMIVRTGWLEAERRLTTQRLTFHKRITDLLEHWFLFFGLFSKRLGCGQLVFSHPQLSSPIILNNVIGIEAKAQRLGKILGVLAVKDRDPSPSSPN